MSILTYRRWEAHVRGLDAFPKQDWPDNIPLLYYSYHIMVGLGTFFVAIMVVALLLLWRGKFFNARWMLWILMLAAPFPYIANTAGWMTAELGRQPWLVYGLMRTEDGYSKNVSAGNGLFTCWASWECTWSSEFSVSFCCGGKLNTVPVAPDLHRALVPCWRQNDTRRLFGFGSLPSWSRYMSCSMDLTLVRA